MKTPSKERLEQDARRIAKIKAEVETWRQQQRDLGQAWMKEKGLVPLGTGPQKISAGFNVAPQGFVTWRSPPKPTASASNLSASPSSVALLTSPPSAKSLYSVAAESEDVAGSGEIDFATGMRLNAADRDAADANNDKKLDFKEFCAFVRDREVGKIPDEELKTRFNALDVDGSGFIDMNEYLQWSLKDSLMRSSSRVVDLFRAWDDDKSGTIDKKEFYKAVNALGFKIEKEDTDAVFDSLDEDGSGALEYAELNMMLRKGAGADLAKRNLKRAPSQRDTGRDAKLTAKNVNANYVSARVAALPAAVKLTARSGTSVQEQLKKVLNEHGAKLIDLFREWDDDGNGAVDKHEFRKAIAALGYDAPKSQIDALFNSMDEDGSGWIEYHELKDALNARHVNPPPSVPKAYSPPPLGVWSAIMKGAPCSNPQFLLSHFASSGMLTATPFVDSLHRPPPPPPAAGNQAQEDLERALKTVNEVLACI